MPTGIEDRWRAAVASLGTALMARDPARSRLVLRNLIGEVQAVTTPDEIRLKRKKAPWKAPSSVLPARSK